MIILDTNVISEAMRAKPNPLVLRWLDEQDPLSLYLTAITVAEMKFGIEALPHGKRRSALTDAIESIISDEFNGRILPFDDRAAIKYGHHMAKTKAAGRAVGVMDGMIAAVALANRNCVVATRDRSPFRAMDVEVIDPWP